MDNTRQRQQWAEHLKDEASARQGQQAAAGTGHAPVAGPLPFSAANLEQAAGAATLHERDRCAGMVAAWADEARLTQAMPHLAPEQRRAVIEVATATAARIRGG